MAKYLQGRFSPKNPQKYQGDPSNIWYRSSYELCVMIRCDSDPKIIEWSSEETVIPYVSPIDGKVHRYFVDMKVKNSDGQIMLIEVKPKRFLTPPKKPKRITKKYITEVAEWGKNQAKFSAATEYANKMGWVFKVITESDIGINNS